MPFEDFVIAHARVASKPHRKATIDDVMTFFHQLATLVGAGTPLLQSISIASQQTESLKLRQVLKEISGRIAAGSSFYAAAAGYPKIFDHSWIEVIRTGEIT